MRNVLGIVNLHHTISMDSLTSRRSLASVGFLGRYAFIDFALSNIVNSDINEIGVLIKEHSRSLFRHLGLSNNWSLNTKLGGVTLLYNEQYANTPLYNTDINNLIENYWFLSSSSAEYVLIIPCHVLLQIDYRKVMEAHLEKKSDVTIIYQKVEGAKDKYINSDYLKINSEGRITDIRENRGSHNERNISCEMYFMSKSKLMDLIRIASQTSSFFTIRDALIYLRSRWVLHGYEQTGYIRIVDSLSVFVSSSLELLSPEIRKQLFQDFWPIYTRTHDTPPVRYSPESMVKDSYIANGSIIQGTVIHSIIGREVIVGKGAVIKNCIIQSHSQIADDAHLEYVVVDKEAHIKIMKHLIGTEKEPLVIKWEDIV